MDLIRALRFPPDCSRRVVIAGWANCPGFLHQFAAESRRCIVLLLQDQVGDFTDQHPLSNLVVVENSDRFKNIMPTQDFCCVLAITEEWDNFDVLRNNVLQCIEIASDENILVLIDEKAERILRTLLPNNQAQDFAYRITDYITVLDIRTYYSEIMVESYYQELMNVRLIAVICQAEDELFQASAYRIARNLLSRFAIVCILGIGKPFAPVLAVHEKIGGIVLAGGRSKRMGRSKGLLLYRDEPYLRTIAKTALSSDLDPVIVVLGANHTENIGVLNDLPVKIIINTQWEQGQASSIQAGINQLPNTSGGAIFFLVDQPQISQAVVRELVSQHSKTLAPIIAPLYDGVRGNPVLFDQTTYQDLMRIQGDTGGRAIFPNYNLTWIEWLDDQFTIDVDTEADYRRLSDLDG